MLEGLPPNGAATAMRMTCDELTAKRIVDIVVETFDPAETAAGAFEIETGEVRSWHAQPWIAEIFFGSPPDEALVRTLVAVAAGPELAAQAVFSAVAKRDWVAASLDGLSAVREGRFVLHGSHGRDAVRVGDIGIEIEAALAFGTGHHGTTRGCLATFNAVARRRRPRRILDIGTGTGVLAIAASRRLHCSIQAGDIDVIAVAAARENARRNAAGTQVRPVKAVGLRHPALRGGAPYDLVFANILAKPLRAMAPQIRAVAQPGAELILSGLLGGDVPAVLSAYRAQGFALTSRRDIEGWATLLLRRGVSSS